MMTQKEARGLARLLKKISEEDFWIPDVAFEALHGAVSMWAPELVIMRGKNRVLLTPYDGTFARGYWHIPGGYNKRNETFQESCSRIAKRELDIDVQCINILGIYKWRRGEHPYGRPLSIFVLCKPRGQLAETERRKFFDVRRLPQRIIPSHRRFIQSMTLGKKQLLLN